MTTTIFSFGYCGWGSATPTLIATFDQVEAERGFGPPVFVDTRIRRAVRAEGFRERAFEHLLGPNRHEWLKDLGNKAIIDGGAWRLHDDKGLDTLLGLAVRADAEGRRVVFFCSCGVPPVHCHRHQLIATALPARAKQRRLDVAVVEWPGGEPLQLTHAFDRKTARLIRSAAARATPEAAPPTVTIADPTAFHAVPWCSTLAVVDEDAPAVVVDEVLIGPPSASAVGWHLPVLGKHASTEAVALRRQHEGYAPLTSNVTSTRWAQTALYTLTHPNNLGSAGRLQLTVQRPMASAAEHLKEAQAAGEAFGVVIGDAVDCANILATGRVSSLTIKEASTELVIDAVQVLPRPRRQQELIVLSTGKPIAVGFIRPYAIVHAPTWLRARKD